MRRLTDQQFQQTFSGRMLQVQPDAAALAQLAAAVKSVPESDLDGFVLDGLSPNAARRSDGGLFEHYVVRTTTANVFLVLVWERVAASFLGFHLLNLNAKYSLPTPNPGDPKVR